MTSRRPQRTLVVGVPPDRAERHVLARAGEDAALADLECLLALAVVESSSSAWLGQGARRRDLGAARRGIAVRLGPVPAGAGAPALALRVVAGAPVLTLADVSAGTLGLYLGRSDAGAGPVALGCAFAARCPVTLVPRGEVAARGPVVVGLDDSQGARQALEHAVEEGAHSGRPVLVLSVVDGVADPTGPGPPRDGDALRRAVEVRSRAIVHELLARRTRARRPDVPVEVEVLEGQPGSVLCDVARRAGASVLVLGARGRGRARGHGTTVGGVALRVLLRAPGTVRIVRATVG